MTCPLDRPAKRARSLRLVLVLVIVSGCGYAEYETRLEGTKKYYAYLDKVEQFLAPKWVYPEMSMELRVPKQFRLIPPPEQPKKKDDADATEAPAIDPRQPDYVNLNFPELCGAWDAMFPTINPDGSKEDRKVYLYALCNYWQVGQQATESTKFVDNLKAQLAEQLAVPVKDEPPETHPAGYPPYQPQLTYDVCSFNGKEMNNTKYRFEVYSRKNGSIVGVIVIVKPEALSMPQNLSERIPMMMGSFNFTSIPPAKIAPGRPEPGAKPVPAAPTGAGF